jgi:hypothetical protein
MADRSFDTDITTIILNQPVIVALRYDAKRGFNGAGGRESVVFVMQRIKKS